MKGVYISGAARTPIASFGGSLAQLSPVELGRIAVIEAMQHTAKGTPKIMRKCSLPLTGMKCVDMIITEKAVFEVTEQGLLLTEIMPGSSLADIQQSTEAELLVAEGVTG